MAVLDSYRKITDEDSVKITVTLRGNKQTNTYTGKNALFENSDYAYYPEKQKDGNWIRNITFAFPVPVNGKELKELSLETGTTVDTFIIETTERLTIKSQAPK